MRRLTPTPPFSPAVATDRGGNLDRNMESKKLTVKWSKRENDILGTYPLGMHTGRDLSYLFGFVFTKEVQEELTRRGYDIKTMKFEISADVASNPDRFPTLHAQLTTPTP